MLCRGTDLDKIGVAHRIDNDHRGTRGHGGSNCIRATIHGTKIDMGNGPIGLGGQHAAQVGVCHGCQGVILHPAFV